MDQRIVTMCRQCGEPIFKRPDGTWDLEWVMWRPTELCIQRDADGDPDGFDASGHVPMVAS